MGQKGSILCSSCGHYITKGSQTTSFISNMAAHSSEISFAGSQNISVQTFINPSGQQFSIMITKKADANVVEQFTDTDTWFEGYKWATAYCRKCYEHLGWKYQHNRTNYSFYGLILSALKDKQNRRVTYVATPGNHKQGPSYQPEIINRNIQTDPYDEQVIDQSVQPDTGDHLLTSVYGVGADNSVTINRSVSQGELSHIPVWQTNDLDDIMLEPDPNLFYNKDIYRDEETFDFTKRTPPPLFDGKKISDTARETCDTILTGFEMGSSENILINGWFDCDCFQHTDGAKKIQRDLDANQELFTTERTSEMHARFKNLQGLLDAIEKKDYQEILKIYYRAQHHHTLASQEPFPVPIYIDSEHHRFDKSWIDHIEKSIQCINTAAPGLNLYVTTNSKNPKIWIGVDAIGHDLKVYTTLYESGPFIHLGQAWPKAKMKGSSTHELLHALGFKHEMQRSDAYLYVEMTRSALENSQYSAADDYMVLTRFDPFSIMMYTEDEHMKRTTGDPIWKIKADKARSETLSELDKVALNLLYKPCRTTIYSPSVSYQTGMLYCGRKVMQTHNQIGTQTTDGNCGPNNWANCPACRVIKCVDTDDTLESNIQKCITQGKWQGLSGLFYCGKRYTAPFNTVQNGKTVSNDGICGFDNGIPCTDCGSILFKDYRWNLLEYSWR